MAAPQLSPAQRDARPAAAKAMLARAASKRGHSQR